MHDAGVYILPHDWGANQLEVKNSEETPETSRLVYVCDLFVEEAHRVATGCMGLPCLQDVC